MKWIFTAALIVSAIFAARAYFHRPVDDDDGVFFPPSQTHSTVSPKTVVTQALDEDPVRTSFRKRLSTVFSGLPRHADLSVVSKRGGSAPRELLAASTGLGEVFQSLRANRTLVNDGLDFYKLCAGSDDILIAVRAVCLKNLRYWTAEKADESAYPARVQEIADKLSRIH